jgi:hypothetical protein
LRTFDSKIFMEALPMPILMIALFALAVFGIIGVLLTAAVILETKKANPTKPPDTPAHMRAA